MYINMKSIGHHRSTSSRCLSPQNLPSHQVISNILIQQKQLTHRHSLPFHHPNSSHRYKQSILTHAEPPLQSSTQDDDNLDSLLIDDIFAIPDATFAKQLGLNEEYLQSLIDLPGTSSTRELKLRLVALSQWNTSLRKGVLPKPTEVSWPQEPFRSKFINTLKKLEMPRFTRRYPKLLSSLLRQFLQLAGEFEGELLDQQAKPQEQPNQNQQQQQQQNNQQNPGSTGDQDSNQPTEGGGESNSKAQNNNNENSEQDQDNKGQSKNNQDQEDSDIQLQLDDTEGGSMGDATNDDSTANDDSADAGFADQLAEAMLKKFEDDWGPAMEALDTAAQTFDDIDSLLDDGPNGFDSSSAVWHSTGWRELAALRKKLEELRELRDLVRSLGRGGGKGPLKKAPELVYRSKLPPGVVRSEESPEETRGLTRSGDLSRMLPLETHLLAAGWPRNNNKTNKSNNSSNNSNDDNNDDDNNNDNNDNDNIDEGSRACRMLFMARRAERMLMSYERTGWVEDQPSRVTGRMEIRPAAELGPIIVCLDTSGSMYGAREVVAKALTLECMRGAHRQQRQCYVYAFSGPGDVMELELRIEPASMPKLLSFLSMSFSGGTDVDAPLALSLERLGREEWKLADILMVTDGEIPSPNQDILQRLRIAHDDLGLEVHGLLVGRNVTEPMKELCTHLHVFKSWSAVGG